MATKEQFIHEYIKAIKDGNAVVFAGAGLSRPSGFVVWKDLLRSLAKDIGLNVDYEYDLTVIAQYIRNQAGNRATINASLLEAYSKNVTENENVAILTRLPIYTYWTTNYDHLIEDGLRNANRNPDVKVEYKQLSSTKRDRDAIVYKMHGDVDFVSNAVLTKDDYIQYDKNYPFFRSVLQGDLISKTFLFIGFSFEDPNLDSIIGQIKLLLDENIRNHYCFMKRVVRTNIMSDEDFGCQRTRQHLREQDLRRYGIQTVFIDEYNEITEILGVIEKAIRINNVFISGSADFFEGDWTKTRIDELAYKLSNRLVKEEFRITSGFGVEIGSSVINGALDEIYSNKFKHVDDYLCLRPFPQEITDPVECKMKWKKYREEIFNEVGVAIFIAGNKKLKEQEEIASGCLQEYKLAKKRNIIIIPIGSTGGAAAIIYADVKTNIEQYPYLEKHLDILGAEIDVDKIINTIMDVIQSQRIGK